MDSQSSSGSSYFVPLGGVPVWLRKRLRALCNSGATKRPHFESSWYGPINGVSYTVFTVKDGFIIKPQAKFRDKVSPPSSVIPGRSNSVSSNTSNMSTSSYNVEARPRTEPGPEADILEPDFVICIAGSSLTGDKIVYIIEIKRGDEDAFKASEQITHYVKRAVSTGAMISTGIVGLLVLGSETFRIKVTDAGSVEIVVDTDPVAKPMPTKFGTDSDYFIQCFLDRKEEIMKVMPVVS
ncbi:hypothetical protein Hypma_004410 [Hypsizygus marmoreus]|uniref:Fungal-type protein kinase domain-containing protein n=1 Tax=Hypsizygus marmoreus TaxID=39966 RepID=A0A369K355_HYPMA|nr:hypothetical protein Hypma_004410 [Hypsizygus marmoreus]